MSIVKKLFKKQAGSRLSGSSSSVSTLGEGGLDSPTTPGSHTADPEDNGAVSLSKEEALELLQELDDLAAVDEEVDDDSDDEPPPPELLYSSRGPTKTKSVALSEGVSLAVSGRYQEALEVLLQGQRHEPLNKDIDEQICGVLEQHFEAEENRRKTSGGGHCSWCLQFVSIDKGAVSESDGSLVCPVEGCGLPIHRCKRKKCNNFARGACSYEVEVSSSHKKLEKKGSFQHKPEQQCAQCNSYIPKEFSVLNRRIVSLDQAKHIYPRYPSVYSPKYVKMIAKTKKLGLVGAPQPGIGVLNKAHDASTAPAGTPGATYYLSKSVIPNVGGFLFENTLRCRKTPSGETVKRPIVITINGFLCGKKQLFKDWAGLVETSRYKNCEWWHFQWNSGTIPKITKKTGTTVAASGIGGVLAGGYIGGMAGIPGMAVGATLAGAASMSASHASVATITAKLFNQAYSNGIQMGKVLADILARTEGRTFVLMGHSLGSHVIKNTLMCLARSERLDVIEDAILLQGATASRSEDWELAARAVRNRIINLHSSKDSVLRYLFRGIKLKDGKDPVGLSPIKNVNKVYNHDCSKFVPSHSAAKKNVAKHLSSILAKAGLANAHDFAGERELTASWRP